jgi:hypothetical protein
MSDGNRVRGVVDAGVKYTQDKQARNDFALLKSRK